MKRVGTVVLVVALGASALLWGGIAMISGRFPGRLLNEAWLGGQAMLRYVKMRQEKFSPDMWMANRYRARGLVHRDPARAYPGYTLYTSAHAERACLVTFSGTKVHEWHLPYARIWEPSAPVRNTRPTHMMFWRDARMMPNGDLITIVVGAGDTPWGLGLIRIDAESNLIWKFLEGVHHQFDIGPDGRIYALTHRIMTAPVPGLPTIVPPCLDDHVVVLAPDGTKLDDLSLFEALRDSDLRYLLEIAHKTPFGEYLHANAVTVITPAVAPALPFARAGQLLVSLPELGALVLLDLDQRAAVWGMIGPWVYEHDPDVLPNGDILIFDNYGHLGPGGISRVIEVDPQTGKIEWQYHGTADRIFGSPTRSGQQRLPNGNTLITESDYGRILEVTREGAIVWEYINPVRGGPQNELIGKLGNATRIAAADIEPGFLARLRKADPTGGGEQE